MNRIVIPCTIAIAVVGMALALRKRPDTDVVFEPVTVHRGDVVDVLREVGVVTPRDPVLVKTPINGTLEWIIDDNIWVNRGDKVFVVNPDEALRQVTEKRTQLMSSRQELSLARMRRRHAQRIERQKVNAARRELELETTRHRILSTPPQGGSRLIELHETLQPLEEQTQRIRDSYEQAQDDYQQAHDAHLEALDRWQQRKDEILRVQTKIDEYEVRSDAKVDQSKPEQVKAHDEAVSQLVVTRKQIDALREDLPQLRQRLGAARQQADAARNPRDKLLAKLEKREANEKELYVQLEIEMRGLKLAQLQFDRQIAGLTLKENVRKQTEAQAAYDGGAISQVKLEQYNNAVIDARNEIAILDEKIKIASRPAPQEELTEARLKMQRAQSRVDNAIEVRDRNLAALDHEITVLEAKLKRSRYAIERMSKGFEAVIEFNIKFLEKELEGLGPELAQTDRRTEIEAELVRLRVDLDRVRENPPNVGRAATDGVARLADRWGRKYHSGDEVRNETVVMEIYPALNMEVRAAVNEANVRRVRQGMPVRITVPAFDAQALTGTISLVARVGRDKYAEMGNWDERFFAGVTQFETRITLDEVPDQLRPGMTVVIEIELDRQSNILHLPRAAVYSDKNTAVVLTGNHDKPQTTTIKGRRYGDDHFIIDSGITEGDTVWIERTSSR